MASVPLLIGEEFGSGKSTLLERVPMLLYGTRNVTIATQSEIESGFNDWLANAQIVCFPEIWLGAHREAERLANRLKDVVTNPVLRVHPKGIRGYSQPNRATILATSNYENAVNLREGDRRWGVHVTNAPKCARRMLGRCIDFSINRGAGVLRHIFMQRDLAAFSPDGEPPLTVGKKLVIAASRSPAQAELVDAFEHNEDPFDWDLFVMEDLRGLLVRRGLDERISVITSSPPC